MQCREWSEEMLCFDYMRTRWLHTVYSKGVDEHQPYDHGLVDIFLTFREKLAQIRGPSGSLVELSAPYLNW